MPNIEMLGLTGLWSNLYSAREFKPQIGGGAFLNVYYNYYKKKWTQKCYVRLLNVYFCSFGSAVFTSNSFNLET